MARKTTKKSSASKKANAKAGKQTARKAGKSSNKRTTSSKATAKKSTAKKSTAKKASAKKATAKKTTANKSTARKANKPTADQRLQNDAPEPEEVLLVLDDLTDVDDLVADPRGTGPAAKKAKNRSPMTPSAPRSVKPPPKHADLEMSAEILEFVDAIDAYRQENSRPFPTWTEVFHVLSQLGYVKVS